MSHRYRSSLVIFFFSVGYPVSSIPGWLTSFARKCSVQRQTDASYRALRFLHGSVWYSEMRMPACPSGGGEARAISLRRDAMFWNQIFAILRARIAMFLSAQPKWPTRPISYAGCIERTGCSSARILSLFYRHQLQFSIPAGMMFWRYAFAVPPCQVN